MRKLTELKPFEVFKYFEEICSIPHGSGDTGKISAYLEDFAKKHSLFCIRDDADNVIIKKDGTCGLESHPAVILQGHTDMVCQKTADSEIDFEKDGLELFTEGDFIRASGTTLGADNGIAVAMIMAVLASDTIAHPPIEAVFTTDEEIGMIGAGKLDVSNLSSKRMVNLDSEEENVLTVSCAGGSDFKATMVTSRKKVCANPAKIVISGLAGGHSGVEIDKGRVNANILAGRLLSHLAKKNQLEIVSIDGGDKGNAIPLRCEISLGVSDKNAFSQDFYEYVSLLKEELSARESGLEITCLFQEECELYVLEEEWKNKLIFWLLETPDGIIAMSKEIPALVETSLNLGILKTFEDRIYMQYALRSNKATSLDFLQEKMEHFAMFLGVETEFSGRYEPWEYRKESQLRELYTEVYSEIMGDKPKVEAIHAGLECAVFSASIPGLDCIAIGPDMTGVHTTEERLSISSTEKIFGILCRLLSRI